MLRINIFGQWTTKPIYHRFLRMHTMPAKPVYVYAGLGANERCRNALYKSLLSNVDTNKHTVHFIKPCEIIAGVLQENQAALLAIGGGYDLGFLEALGPTGTQQIRRYVESGGAYLGICAGGYFACDAIEFDKGGPLEVCGKRDLQFFPGLCVGPVYPGFQYKSETGAHASRLCYTSPDTRVLSHFDVYFNGGGKFLFHPPSVHCDCCCSSDGLSSTMTPKKLAETNGVRQEIFTQGEAPIDSQHCGDKQSSFSREDCLETLQPVETIEGRCVPVEQAGARCDASVLAVYSELEGKPAAVVKSHVGSGGIVILSGAHIEYEVDFLPVEDCHISRIRDKLQTSESRRMNCFRACLQQLRLNLR